MNLLFWKHKPSGKVISHECYNKLPADRKPYENNLRKNQFESTSQTATHYIEEADGETVTQMFLAELISTAAVNQIDAESAAPSETFSGFGGGDFGGGDSSGSFDSPGADPSPSFDSGSFSNTDF